MESAFFHMQNKTERHPNGFYIRKGAFYHIVLYAAEAISLCFSWIDGHRETKVTAYGTHNLYEKRVETYKNVVFLKIGLYKRQVLWYNNHV